MERSKMQRAVDRCVKFTILGNGAQRAELRLIQHMLDKKKPPKAGASPKVLDISCAVH